MVLCCSLFLEFTYDKVLGGQTIGFLVDMVFNIVDENQTGKISRGELEHLMEWFGMGDLSEEAIEYSITLEDVNMDNEISLAGIFLFCIITCIWRKVPSIRVLIVVIFINALLYALRVSGRYTNAFPVKKLPSIDYWR